MVALCAGGAGVLLPAVIGYATLIATMAILATGVDRVTATGAVLFMVSDSMIALTPSPRGGTSPGRVCG